MITIAPQKGGDTAIFDAGRLIGTVAVSHNPFHKRNAYLTLRLQRYDGDAAPEFFRALRERLACPLQVMVGSGEEDLALFLTAGGFERKRRCFETEAATANLRSSLGDTIPFKKATKGSGEYNLCCEAQYKSYAETHRAVNPLTADLPEFCRVLPEAAAFSVENGRLCHWAFLEENEIAYVGTRDMGGFSRFAGSLLADMFTKYDTVRFEADDCDGAAMALRSFFDLPATPFCDTYVSP